MQLTKLATVPVVVLAVSSMLILVFQFSDRLSFNPPYLLFTLNVVFWTLAMAAILYISIKSYLQNGSLTIFLISVSILIFGSSVIVSGWVSNSSGNQSVALSNPCLLVAATLQVASSVLSLTGKEGTPTINRKVSLLLAYSGSLLFVGLISALAVSDSLPTFFTASGPTLLRQAILGSAAILFGVAFIIFAIQYAKSKAPSLLLYALAIALLAIGLFTAFEVKAIGDVPTWLGRATLYVGTVYLIVAIVRSRKSDPDLSAGWTETFRSDRQQFETLFARMLNGFAYQQITVDTNGKPVDYIFLAANEAFEKLTGLKRRDIIGKKVTEVLPGIQKDPADWIGKYGRVALTGEPTQFENYAEPLKRWYSVSAYSPKKGYFAAIFEDITERKKAQEAIRESEQRFRSVLNNSLDVIYRFNVQTEHYEYMSPSSKTVLGYEPEELMGMSNAEVLSLVHPDDLAILKTELARINENGKGISEYRFKSKNGKYIWWSNQIVITRDKDGKPLYRDGFVRDITERKEAEDMGRQYSDSLEALVDERTKKLRSLAMYARSLIEASLDPLVTINVEGKITDVNSATELATGCSREELIGSDFSDYFTDPEKAREGYKKVFTKGWVRDYPLAIKCKTGEVIDVLYNAVIYKNEAGDPQGVFAAARDVRELRKAEKLAEERARQLKDAERLAAIGATAGMVGHDIRNPLQAIVGDVYLLKDEVKEIPGKESRQSAIESAQAISENVEYINKIVADLQDYARPIKAIPKEVDLKRLIHGCLRKDIVPKSIKVYSRVEDDAKKIVADPDFLKRILGNLVMNAIQAMPDGGKLSVRAFRDADGTVITVEDTGTGIPESAKSKVFTPLFTTKSKGQGFGLAVVKRMTEAQNGSVTFESEVGKGTKFAVYLPNSQDL
jgi:PAS domain S-box-containing protein